tara:strand:- start:8818 stop:11625 length:2808 start_codon:yes stop_codon:yes gene_type:complete
MAGLPPGDPPIGDPPGAPTFSQEKTIFNTHVIDAEFIEFGGQHTLDGDVHFIGNTDTKFEFDNDVAVNENKKLMIHHIYDKDGTKIIDTAGANLVLQKPLDLNNFTLLNNPDGGGGGTITTNDVDSINYPGQKLEHELDQLTLTQNTVKARTEGLTANKIMVSNGAGLLATGSIGENSLFVKGLSNNCSSNPPNLNTFNSIICIPSSGSGGTCTATEFLVKPNSTAAAAALNFSHLAGKLTNANIDGNSITGGKIQVGSLPIGKIEDGNLLVKTDDEGVVSNDMLSGGIATSKLTDGSSFVKTTDTGTVSNNMLAGNIATSKLVEGSLFLKSVGVSDLPTGIPSANLADNGIIVKTTDTGTVSNAMLAGNIESSKLQSSFTGTLIKNNVAGQNILSSTGNETKLNIINNNALNHKAILSVQKTDNNNVLKTNLRMIANDTGTTIQAGGTSTADISIIPASNILAMTIGSLETRVHNNFKILGSMSGAARSDTKEYIFKTTSTGTGSSLLLEELIFKPVQGSPSAPFNPTAASTLSIATDGTTSYTPLTNFLTLPGSAAPTAGPSFIKVDTAGAKTYETESNYIKKPGGNNPTGIFNNAVVVNSSGTMSYQPITFAPMPNGLLPTSTERILVLNPAGSSYENKSNFILKPEGSNPTDNNSMITVATNGTVAYKKTDEIMYFDESITYTGRSNGGANFNTDFDIRNVSTSSANSANLLIRNFVSGAQVHSLHFQASGTTGTNMIMNSKETLEHQINGTKIFETKSDRLHVAKQLEVEDFVSIDYNGFATDKAALRITNGRSTGASNANETDVRQISFGHGGSEHEFEHIIATNHHNGVVGGNKMSFYINTGASEEEIGASPSNVVKALELSAVPGTPNTGLATVEQLQILNILKIPFGNVPASSSAVGFAGHIGLDANHLYICVGTNSWKRIALSTF